MLQDRKYNPTGHINFNYQEVTLHDNFRLFEDGLGFGGYLFGIQLLRGREIDIIVDDERTITLKSGEATVFSGARSLELKRPEDDWYVTSLVSFKVLRHLQSVPE